MENSLRFKTTYDKVLEPFYSNFYGLLKTCNSIDLEEEITVKKYPNYSNEKLPGNRETLKSSEQNKVNFIWDAIKITISCTVHGKRCYRSKVTGDVTKIM